ncbi:MAG: diaminopimelate decarboxylase [Roseiflexaceae bacterium]
MSEKTFPCSQQQIEAIAASYPTPFYLYDERAIRANVRALRKAFAWADGFQEYFAVKALPNPFILQILRAEGLGADCSSLPELLLAERASMSGEQIMFSSNDTPASEFQLARRLGAIINLDDLSHLAYLEQHTGLPDLLCFRYNPGRLRAGNDIIGRPEEAKFGLMRAQLFDAYAQAHARGVRRFGLHTMVASNELNPHYFVETAAMLFDLVAEIAERLGIACEFVNIGGGIGIPYRPEQSPVDLQLVSAGIAEAYRAKILDRGLAPLKLFLECGRVITGPYGYLISRVRHIKRTYKQFIGMDACMADLMRPGMYGAYHHITALGKQQLATDALYDVTGSLCENNDKFAIDRPLPPLEIGDLLAFHDVGAHGHAMGFNYNGKLRPAELLLRENGDLALIRRAETVEDYFATLPLDELEAFSVE